LQSQQSIDAARGAIAARVSEAVVTSYSEKAVELLRRAVAAGDPICVPLGP
jgi:hypothetical protein